MTVSEPPPEAEDNVATSPRGDRSFMDDLGGPERPPAAGGFSLASLFLLVTAASVVALLARNIVETRIEPTWIVIHALVGGFVGGIAGGAIGAGYPRVFTGLLLGWFVGTLTGGVCAATAASGGSPWLFCVGAAALVTLGIASRWMHRTKT